MDFRSLEGGEIRFEWRQLPNATAQTTVTQAWFATEQIPAKLAGPMFGTCSNVRTYESAAWPPDAVRNSRAYLDVGDNIQLVSPNTTVQLNRAPAAVNDFRGHSLELGYVGGTDMMGNPSAFGGVDVSTLEFGQAYDVVLANGAEVKDPIYMPAHWTTVTGPQFDGTTHIITAGQDFVWEFDAQDEVTDAPLSFLLFATMDATWFCPFENTGSITISSDLLAQLPARGNLLAATMNHTRSNFNGRNLDLIAANCKIQAYEIQ